MVWMISVARGALGALGRQNFGCGNAGFRWLRQRLGGNAVARMLIGRVFRPWLRDPTTGSVGRRLRSTGPSKDGSRAVDLPLRSLLIP